MEKPKTLKMVLWPQEDIYNEQHYDFGSPWIVYLY
jgi:hypothetical protein